MKFTKLLPLALSVAVMTLGPVGTASASKSWPVYGGDLRNSHNAKYTGQIRTKTVEERGFKLKWKQSNDGLAVEPSAVTYEETSQGPVLYHVLGSELVARNATTGNIIWRKSLPAMGAMLGVNWLGTRSTPTIYKNYLIQAHQNTGGNVLPFLWSQNIGTGLWVFAVDKRTGAFDPANGIGWATKIEAHPNAIGSASPAIYNGTVYIGYGGDDYTQGPVWPLYMAFLFGYQLPVSDFWDCCNVRGSMTALNADTGFVKWKTYTIPPRPGEENLVGLDATGPKSPLLRTVDPTSVSGPGTWYSGATTWSSAPAVDTKRGLLYISTGNNGSVAPISRMCEMKRQGLIPANDPALTAELAALSTNFGSAVTCDGENNTTVFNDAFHLSTVYVNKNPDGNYYPEYSYGNLANAVVALDLNTGKKAWHYRMQEYDSYTVACDYTKFGYLPQLYSPPLTPFPMTPILVLPGNPSFNPLYQVTLEQLCPYPANKLVAGVLNDKRDNDFGQSPILVKVKGYKSHIGQLYSLFSRHGDNFDKEKDFYEEALDEEDGYEEDGYDFFKKVYSNELVLAANKGGEVIALDPNTGKKVWRQKVAAGGTIGGFEWASAADDEHIYVIDSMSDNRTIPFGFGGSINDWTADTPFFPFDDSQHLSYHTVCKLVADANRINPFELVHGPAPAYATGRLTSQEIPANLPSDDACIIPKNADGTPGLTTTYGQVLSAIRLKDGALVWQYADPSGDTTIVGNESTIFRSYKNHGVTLANGVVFDSTQYGLIRMHDAKTGRILRELDLRGTGYEQALNTAPTIVGNQVFYLTGSHVGMDLPFPFNPAPGACGGVDCSANAGIIALELCPPNTTVSSSNPTQCVNN